MDRAAHYRCLRRPECSGAIGVEHPRSVYVREAPIIEKLDRWLAEMFNPKNKDKTAEALAAVSRPTRRPKRAQRRRDARSATATAASRSTVRRSKPVARLTSSPDGWPAVEGERLAAERELGRSVPKAPITKAEAKALVRGVKEAFRRPSQADPKLKEEL